MRATEAHFGWKQTLIYLPDYQKKLNYLKKTWSGVEIISKLIDSPFWMNDFRQS